MENQELANLVGNLNSITDQISQLISGGADSGEPEIEPVMEMEDDAMVEKIMKFLKQEEPAGEEETVEMAEDEEGCEVEKAEDGATASDDAEERIEDQPDENLDNIQEVAKAIAKALKNTSIKKSVKKSVKANPLSKEIQYLRSENKEIKKALEGIFEGMGIADEIKKSQEIDKPKEKGVAMNDASEIKKTLDFIKSGLSVGQETTKVSNPNNDDFRKSLIDNDGQLLKGLFRKSAG